MKKESNNNTKYALAALIIMPLLFWGYNSMKSNSAGTKTMTNTVKQNAKTVTVQTVSNPVTITKTTNTETNTKQTETNTTETESQTATTEDTNKKTPTTVAGQFASTNTIELSAPYNGGTTVFLNTADAKNITFTCDEKCDFDGGNYTDSERLKISFDGKPAEIYGYVYTKGKGFKSISLLNPTKFNTNLKQAKKVSINVAFKKDGYKTLEFNTEDLQ